MKKKLTFFVFFIFFVYSYTYAQVTFPYFNDLKGSTPADIVVAQPSSPGLQFTENGIQLTNDSEYSAGAVVLENVTFNSSNGFSISFEYDMFGGKTSYLNGSNSYGDAISMFLYDATAPLEDLLGATGGRLGYLYDRRSEFLKKGMNKAYLGIGFDIYGNFKTNLESQSGIVANFANKGRDYVSIRGAVRHAPIGLDSNGGTTSSVSNNPDIYNEARFAGYPVLYTVGTNGFYDGAGIIGSYLDMQNNSLTQVNYVSINEAPLVTYPIRNEALNPASNDVKYRKVFINLAPVSVQNGGGMYVTVSMQAGINFITLIDNYHYKKEFYYLENSNSGNPSTAKIQFIEAPVPVHFKIGFMGATGKATQFQYIRNLNMDIAYKPQFSSDFANYCNNQKGSIILKPFDNDFTYNGEFESIPILSTGPQNIDYSSFRFISLYDGIFDSNLGTTNGNITTYVNPNQGTWIFNSTTGSVNFTPKIGFMGTAFVYYDAKGTASLGGPYSQEIYRSSPTKIEVNVLECGSHINPQLPSGGVTRSDK